MAACGRVDCELLVYTLPFLLCVLQCAVIFFTKADAYGRVKNWSRLSYNYRCENVENWSSLSYIASSTHDSASPFQFHARFGLRLNINVAPDHKGLACFINVAPDLFTYNLQKKVGTCRGGAQS